MDTPFKEVNNHSRKMIINVVLTFLFSSVSIVFLTLSCSFDFVFYYSLPLFVSVSILAFCIIFLVSSVSDYNMYLFNEITASISKKYQDAHTEVDDILCIKIEDIVLGLLREQEYRPHSLESAKEYLNTFKHDEFVIKIYDRYEEMKTSKRTFLNYAKAYGKEIKNDRVEKYCFSIKSMCFTLFEGNKKSVEKYTNRSLSIINQILEDEKEAIRLKREKEKAEKAKADKAKADKAKADKEKAEAEAKAKRKAAAKQTRSEQTQQKAANKSNKSANISAKMTQSQRNDSIRAAQQKGRKINKSSADND